MRLPASDPIDDRLRELLAVEQRLQSRVAQARDEAARRIADARAASARQLADADASIAASCAAEAHTHEARQRAALDEIESVHATALAAIAAITDADIDRLARLVLERLRAELGGPT